MLSNRVLFITLDSCRYDSFLHCQPPNLLKVGPLHKALSPSHFTFGSHSAMWMGFTPGVFSSTKPWINPKLAKLFRLSNSGSFSKSSDGYCLEGRNIIDGFNRLGFNTIGSGAVGWFDDHTETGRVLSSDFQNFFYPGNTWSLSSQISWIFSKLTLSPTFCFLNVGETHVPYWHEGAPWPRHPSPCIPFAPNNSRAKSSFRQISCLRWIDTVINPLLEEFMDDTIIVTADHGECWGEDSLWEHGVSHPMTLTVPLLLRVNGKPVST